MFSKRSGGRDVADIQAWLAAADPAAGPLEASTAARLAALWHRVDSDGLHAGPPGRRAWWPKRAKRAWWPKRAGRQHRRKILIACVAAPALTAATAAGWVVAAGTPGSYVAQQVWCFASPGEPPGSGVETAPSGQGPVAECAQMWAQGWFGSGAHRVPPLVACSLGSWDGGSVGVYPDTTCRAEHLPPLPAGYQQAALSMATLISTLEADGLLGSGDQTHPVFRCSSPAAAVTLVRQALQRSGFTGWQIDVQPSPGGSRCAYADPDSASHTVTITGN